MVVVVVESLERPVRHVCGQLKFEVLRAVIADFLVVTGRAVSDRCV